MIIYKVNGTYLEKIIALRSYLNTTSELTNLFNRETDLELSARWEELIKGPKFFPTGFVLLGVWLGLLNCVVEGWFELKLHDKTIDSMIGSSSQNKTDEASALGKFRNQRFHFQTKKQPLYSDFLYDGKSLQWAFKLNLELEKWFDYYYTANTLPRDTPGYEWFKNSAAKARQ
jgi:hypothetical protein